MQDLSVCNYYGNEAGSALTIYGDVVYSQSKV